MKRYYVFFALLILMVAVAAVAQSTISLSYSRDTQKLQDMELLSTDIQSQGTKDNKLPAKLADVKLSEKLAGKLSDYTYAVKAYNRFELCTTYAHATLAPRSTELANGSVNRFHGAGRECTTVTVDGIFEPAPLIQASSDVKSCVVGTRDQKWTLTDVIWDGFDADAKAISVHSGNQKQTFRWCGVPYVTNVQGYYMNLPAVPVGGKVNLNVTSPGTANANGTASYGVPYVTTVQVKPVPAE